MDEIATSQAKREALEKEIEDIQRKAAEKRKKLEEEIQQYDKLVQSTEVQLDTIKSTINKKLDKLELAESGRIGGVGGGGVNLPAEGVGALNPLYLVAPLAAVAAGRAVLQKRDSIVEEQKRIEEIRERIRKEEEELVARKKDSKTYERVVVSWSYIHVSWNKPAFAACVRVCDLSPFSSLPLIVIYDVESIYPILCWYSWMFRNPSLTQM